MWDRHRDRQTPCSAAINQYHVKQYPLPRSRRNTSIVVNDAFCAPRWHRINATGSVNAGQLCPLVRQPNPHLSSCARRAFPHVVTRTIFCTNRRARYSGSCRARPRGSTTPIRTDRGGTATQAERSRHVQCYMKRKPQPRTFTTKRNATQHAQNETHEQTKRNKPLTS